MAYRRLPLVESQYSLVFRTIEGWLRSDPDLGKVVRPDAWKTFMGDPSDASGLPVLQGVVMRLIPSIDPITWATPDSMFAPLNIHVSCCVAGLLADDYLNLQQAIETAIYPKDPTVRMAREEKLRAAPMYCETGLVTFSMPLGDRSAEIGTSGNWYPVGTMSIIIRRVFN